MPLGGTPLGSIPLGGEPEAQPPIAEPFVLKIGGVDYTSTYVPGSVQIKDTLNARNTCEFSVNDMDQVLSFQCGQPIEIIRGGAKIFAGTIENVTRQSPLAGGFTVHSIEGVDFNQLTDRFLVFKNYETASLTLGDIVRDIVNVQTALASEGVSVAGVQDGPTVIQNPAENNKLIFNGQTVREAFDELSRATGFSWYLDYDRDLKFFDRSTYLAPFSIADANARFLSLETHSTRERYRNVQYLRGGIETTDDRVQTFKGDGETKSFSVDFEVNKGPASSPTKPIVKVNLVTKVVGVRGVDPEKNTDGTPSSFDWFWKKGDKEITSNNEKAAPISTDTIQVTYVGQFPLLIEGRDVAEIAARLALEGGTGIYEHLEVDEDVDGLDVAEFKVDGLLRQLGRILNQVQIETLQEGLKAGMLIRIDFSENNVHGDFLIDQLTISDVRGQFLRYGFTALDGEHVQGWPEFFRRIFETGKRVSLRENEKLELLRRFTETITVSDSLTYALSAITTTPEEDPYTVGMFNTAGGVYAAKVGKAKFGKHPLRT